MARAERLEIIKRIEQKRGSRLICYLTADRPARIRIVGLSTALSSEAQPWFIEHIRNVGKVKQIDLFLYTRGGDTDSVWPLVNQIREHCEKLCVLVPFRAHSAGTLICLGADEIVMSKYAELSPVDPTTGNPFNPIDELVPGSRKGISVEDVTAYIALAKDKKKVGLKKPEQLLEVFKKLTDNVHPLALGNVNRSHTQIRMLARKLLSLGTAPLSTSLVDEVIDTLTEKLYSHLHAINRKEASRLLRRLVVVPEDKLESDMWALYEDFSKTMRLKERFNLLQFMGQNLQATVEVIGGFIESTAQSTLFSASSRVSLRSQLPSGFSLQVPVGQQGQVKALPLIPGFPTEINIEVLEEGWQDNTQGV